MSIEQWEAASKAFESGTIEQCSNAELRAHLLALSNQSIHNASIQHRDVIRGITLNHLILQHHIDRLDCQNTKTQRWFMALAVASLIGTAVQVYYAVRPSTLPAPGAQQPARVAPGR